jgi:1-aminocyclopropane-1-carboxylate deaminase
MAPDPITLPEPFASIPKSTFLFGPSPVHHLPRISSALGGKVSIWAKREDCNSGIAFGGNKTRKLEYGPLLPHSWPLSSNPTLTYNFRNRYLIPEALSQGCDTLISIGGVQSNHTRQVAGVAAKLGLKVSHPLPVLSPHFFDPH